MKRTLTMLFAAFVAFSLSGCFLFNSATPEEYQVPTGHYRLTADFSNGALDGELKFLDAPINSAFYDSDAKSTVHTQAAYEAAIMEIADYLSEWTGLDFTLNGVSVSEDGYTVDWSEESTLLAGLDDREQKEDFHFFDAASLNWFMLDTLYQSITANLPISFLYYSRDGKPLEFMAEDGLITLPLDEPYLGSYPYLRTVELAQSGSRGGF